MNLPMTKTLRRFGDVPADFVEAEMRVVKMEQDALEWARSTRLGDAVPAPAFVANDHAASGVDGPAGFNPYRGER